MSEKNKMVFLTGATGFLGSRVAEALLEAGYGVVALKRKTSRMERCVAYRERIAWVDLDDESWPEAVRERQPQVFIHSAWAGVGAADRNDWDLQFINLIFFSRLLQLARDCGAKQWVAFGSQAEYGHIDGRVDESHPCQPITVYGTIKLAALALLEGFARLHALNYVWLRLFSIYGPGESEAWFIPSLVKNFSLGRAPALTGCEQRYDYLHVNDFAAGVIAVLARPEAAGVFNFSSNAAICLREVVQLVRQYTGSRVEPEFGALPYRPNQSMHLEGDSTRFYRTFGFSPRLTMREGLRCMIEARP
jgi:nucleoside-diphosphate-sugar epimerase